MALYNYSVPLSAPQNVFNVPNFQSNSQQPLLFNNLRPSFSYPRVSPNPQSEVPFRTSNYPRYNVSAAPSQGTGVPKPSPQTGYFKRVTAGGGSKTSVHAVIDYDDDFNESPDYADRNSVVGPISLKNNSVPVIPRYAYDGFSNGSLVQIPILWSALSLALGYEVRGDLIRGLPCIKRNHQLYCPAVGNPYPIDQIERFIDENKALMKRMFGEFQSSQFGSQGEDTFEPYRTKRKTGTKWKSEQSQTSVSSQQDDNTHQTKTRYPRLSLPTNSQMNDDGRMDSCESKLEIVTPYWANNSAHQMLAIVNTDLFEQAVHQEKCTKQSTNRCTKDCRCEQKYQWHRLLAYDPSNDCKGIFTDWFLFPSCCVCRCNSS